MVRSRPYILTMSIFTFGCFRDVMGTNFAPLITTLLDLIMPQKNCGFGMSMRREKEING